MKPLKRLLILLISSIAASLMFSVTAFAYDGTAASLDEFHSLVNQNIEERTPNFAITYTGSLTDLIRDGDTSNLKLSKERFSDGYTAWCYRKYGISYSGIDGDLKVSYFFTYYNTLAEEQAFDAQLETIYSSIIKDTMNTYDKERAIHDYVVSTLDYVNDGPEISNSAYNALQTKHAVCQAYALITYRLLKMAGIESKVVVGEIKNPTTSNNVHMWLLVKLGEVWYHLDPTWDDPIPNAPGVRSSTYFNTTDTVMTQTHSWDTTKFPDAKTPYDVYKETKFKNALYSVKKAESSRTNTDYSYAKNVVSALPISEEKTVLQKKLNELLSEGLTPSPNVFKKMEIAVIASEKLKTQKAVNAAKLVLANYSGSADKKTLQDRLSKVQAIINATKLVVKAENTKTKINYKIAVSAVTALGDSPDKMKLNSRLKAIESKIK